MTTVAEAPVEEDIVVHEPKYELTVLDRCDQCRAQAYIKAIFPSGSYLLFCRHDYLFHKDVLDPQLSSKVDETERLFNENKHKGTEIS